MILVALLSAAVPVGIFVGRWLVTRVAPRTTSPALGLLIGLLLLMLIGLIPIVGWVAKGLTVLLGMGVYARAVRGMVAEQRLQVA